MANSAITEKISSGKAGAAALTTSTRGCFEAASCACGTTETAVMLIAM
jgi:hypothetical protein